MHARYGEKVKPGRILVVLDSPEVGKARLDLRARQRELATARFEAKWKNEIADNVQALIPELKRGIAEDTSSRHHEAVNDHHSEEAQHELGTGPARSEAIELHGFAGKDLGLYRRQAAPGVRRLPRSAVIHEEEKNIDLQRHRHRRRPIPSLLPRHTRTEGLQAELTSIIEDTQYVSAQERRMADQALRQAEAAVVDAAQRLRILDVHTRTSSISLDHPEEANKAGGVDEDIARYDIVAPFDGHILKKFAAPSQKADMSDVLFVLADLRTVWVKADINESDVAKLSRLGDGTIRFRATAYPDREFQARLISVGSVVDPQTRTVPILAEADNPDGLLKVGMFARILVDSSAVEEALTVPAAAVVEKDGIKCVFVPGDSPRTFTIRPVEVGRQAGDRATIKAGLKPGDQVVASGAFFLKSELILQNEPEED